jgi:hypothetical protein
MMTRDDETRAVKAALKKAGLVARVKHGKGTTFGWLNVTLPPCDLGVLARDRADRVRTIIRTATDRSRYGMECVSIHGEWS